MRELAARAFCEAQGIDRADLPIIFAGWRNGRAGIIVPDRGFRIPRELSEREEEAVNDYMRACARGEVPWPV